MLIHGIDTQTLNFSLTSDATVNELKQAISLRTSVSPSEVKLAYCGKPLQDGRRLADYNFQSDSMVYASLDMVGGHNDCAVQGVGFSFVNLATEKDLKVHQWDKSGDNGCEWFRAYEYGLNLEGTCTNDECEAYCERVIIPWGNRNFNFAKHDKKGSSCCPMCKEYVQPVTCAFSNTKWNFKGVKRRPKMAPEDVEGTWKQVGDAYHYFDEGEIGSAWWSELEIMVKEVDAS